MGSYCTLPYKKRILSYLIFEAPSPESVYRCIIIHGFTIADSSNDVPCYPVVHRGSEVYVERTDSPPSAISHSNEPLERSFVLSWIVLAVIASRKLRWLLATWYFKGCCCFWLRHVPLRWPETPPVFRSSILDMNFIRPPISMSVKSSRDVYSNSRRPSRGTCHRRIKTRS